MSEFQKCPKCGAETFTEVCQQWTQQDGVRIDAEQCKECETDYEIGNDGKLTERRDNDE